MTAILSNLQAVRLAIAQAAQAAQRDVSAVRLLAVSKTFSADAVRVAYAGGQTAFGENYLQEALDKIALLQDLPLEWHFIGPIQSNKTRPIAASFAWVHSVDRLKIAERLSAQRPAHLPPLNICLQVNVSGEQSKGGVSADELPLLAQEVERLPHLQVARIDGHTRTGRRRGTAACAICNDARLDAAAEQAGIEVGYVVDGDVA